MDYVSAAYGVDGLDTDLYHLMLDSTSLDLDTCVDVIVAASHGPAAQPPRPTPPI